MDPRDKLLATLPGVHNVTHVTARHGMTTSSHGIPASCYVDVCFHGEGHQMLTQTVFFKSYAAAKAFADNVNGVTTDA